MADDESQAPAGRPSSGEVTPAPSRAYDIFSARSRKQFGLFFAGATFCVLSALITRRSLLRKYKATVPTFYQPSNRPARRVNGAFEAFEALNLATLNVTSGAIMVTGGVLWALDISSVEELRRKIRGGMGIDGSGRTEAEAEEEIEEWIATALARKDEKEARRKGPPEPRTNERGAPR